MRKASGLSSKEVTALTDRGTLPQPSNDALSLSHMLTKVIIQHIQKTGDIPFSEFMRLALYYGHEGYYQNGLRKFGPKGDFVTAPEISPLFSHCLANQYLEIREQLDLHQVLEFGAGSGVMAVQLLKHLEQHQQLPAHYFIVETSPALVAQQQARLQSEMPHYFRNIQWLTHLPKAFQGIIIANEVLDAMPVDIFRLESELTQAFITYESAFKWRWKPSHQPPEYLPQAVSGFRPGYQFETNAYLKPWLSSLNDCLDRGVILLIDYGYPRTEYFHPQRGLGSLACHYRHQMHDDPLILVGLQDITAHVNFSDVADYAISAGLTLCGYTTQAQFLIGTGLLNLSSTTDPVQQLLIAQQIKTLILPTEMGERFQVMALSTHALSLQGFAHDLSHRL